MDSKGSSFFESFKYSANYAAMEEDGTKKLSVGVHKPIKQSYFKGHEDEAMSFQSLALKIKENVYLLKNNLWESYSKELNPITFYLCQTKKGNLFFWPVKGSLQDQKLDGWNTSAHRVIKDARQNWIRLMSNQEVGRYEIMFANDQTAVAVWPEKTLEELLEVAFDGRIISDENDPILRELRGEL